jgi:deoxycytidylate deaminase
MEPANITSLPAARGRAGSREICLAHTSNELFFGIVGHVGSGNSTVAERLAHLLKKAGFTVTELRAREEIRNWAVGAKMEVPSPEADDLVAATRWQDLGDEMRRTSGDSAAVARALVVSIQAARAGLQGEPLKSGEPVKPDGSRRAYILDSLRHDAEVHLLRHVYGNAFTLIGVVCEEEGRVERLASKYKDAGKNNAKEFMGRDAEDPDRKSYGQHVSDTFELSDFFINNSEQRYLDDEETESNPDWDIPEQLSRLLKIIAHSTVARPTTAETAMYVAHGARMRSSCLSRQVGAALVDEAGNIVATGTNDPPRAGGGVYGEGFDGEERKDGRCCVTPFEYCSSTREQDTLIAEVIKRVPALKDIAGAQLFELTKTIKRAGVGGLVEFSRAVHAEMGALLSATRTGVGTVGARMFVTTFPCHYCARHLVAAGISEVQYIEPYPKSRALSLHKDAITTSVSVWSKNPPSRPNGKVLFRPFTGVAPRMYSRAFLKDRELKDASGVLKIGEAQWGDAWHLGRASYIQLEAKLAAPENGSHE